MVGYRNYSRCYCPVCAGSWADFRQRHPQLAEKEAFALWAEQVLVDFLQEMAQAARAARPGIELTIHIYPYFRPHPNYGNRLDLNTVGQTVSNFVALIFEPPKRG
jgi:hypothetical protein